MTRAARQLAGRVGGFMAAAILGVSWLGANVNAAAEDASAEGTVVIDGLMWAVRSNGEDIPWNPANAYCEALELAGHNDWRLPTLAEIESVYDPAAEDNDYISSPLVLDGCCLWSSTSLADLSAEEGGLVGGQRDDPRRYYWGFLYAGGIRYYSVIGFPDGQAQCVRDPQG